MLGPKPVVCLTVSSGWSWSGSDSSSPTARAVNRSLCPDGPPGSCPCSSSRPRHWERSRSPPCSTCGAEAIADPKVRSAGGFEHVTSPKAGDDHASGPASPHLDHPHLPIQEDDRDRLLHAERVHAPASPEEHRLARAGRRVAPQPTHPLPPGLGNQDAPLAAGPVHLDDLHGATVRSVSDVGRAGFEPATRGLKAPCSRPD